MVSVALPLFVVTMASQNLPGVAAQRASGYNIPVSPVVGATGLASFLLAPFGGYALNLAAITAAICMGKEAHPDPARRYTASVFAGLLYIALGLAAGTIVSLMAAFPQALVLAVAGLALLGTMTAGLTAAVKDEQHREAASERLDVVRRRAEARPHLCGDGGFPTEERYRGLERRAAHAPPHARTV
jgi:benzoate membrane transport protein